VQCVRCCDAILAGRVKQRPCHQPLQFVQGFDMLWVVEICNWSQLRQLLTGRSQPSLVDLPLEEADFEVLQRCLVARKLLRVPAMELLCFREDAALHDELWSLRPVVLTSSHVHKVQKHPLTRYCCCCCDTATAAATSEYTKLQTTALWNAFRY
jgi:hypothetical protein